MKNKILLIDDDQDFVEAMEILLEANGYEVITASNGKEGFQKVKEESPDLIFLDMMMTYKTEGAETAKAMSADAAIQDIPIILVTGAGKDKDFPYALKNSDLPVKRIIEKPISPDTLLQVTKAYIRSTGREHRDLIGQLDGFVAKWRDKQGNLIMILHEIQNHYGYVPRNVAFELCRLLDIPLARVYEVITFYNYFKLDSPGKHLISMCMGTACYLKGTPQILEEIKNIIGIEDGETTPDGLFQLQHVRCLGCCGLAPVMMIDDKVYGKVKRSDVMDILSEYTKEAAGQKGELR